MPKQLLVIVACAALAAAFAPFALAAELFDARPYAEAKAAAEKDAKWFIVKGTAEWCGPCKQMERITWKDEKVVAWMEKHAIAVSVDVDQLPEIARELRIRAMPTIIAFKDGAEFDRVVGMQTPAQFNTWLAGMADGRKSLDAAVDAAGGLEPPHGKIDVKARLELARRLAGAGKHVQAANQYAWLWKHILKHEPSMVGVRLSFMVSEMEELASESEAARELFKGMRDETAARLQAAATDDAVDWVHLNRIVGEEDRTVEWYRKVAFHPRWSSVVVLVDDDVSEYLASKGRTRELGELCRDPLGALHLKRLKFELIQSAMKHAAAGAEQQALEVERSEQLYREDVAMLYAALLVADRERDAGMFAVRARKLDPSEAMSLALVRRAIKEREPRESHLRWLREYQSEETKILLSEATFALISDQFAEKLRVR